VTASTGRRILDYGMIFRLAPISLFAILAAAPVAALAQAGTTPPPDQQRNPPARPADDLPDSPGAAEGLEVPPAPNGPTVIMDTTMGRLTCQFFQKESPMTVANFVELATGQKDFTDPKTGQVMHNVPFYDGTTFHRVIANFMIQGGDRRGDGTGDAGYYIGEERSPGLRFDREGRLAMANAGPAAGVEWQAHHLRPVRSALRVGGAVHRTRGKERAGQAQRSGRHQPHHHRSGGRRHPAGSHGGKACRSRRTVTVRHPTFS